jgi:hypothetical protein
MKLLSTQTLKVIEHIVEHPKYGTLILKDFYAADKDKVVDCRLYTQHGDEITSESSIANPVALLEEIQEFIDANTK